MHLHIHIITYDQKNITAEVAKKHKKGFTFKEHNV